MNIVYATPDEIEQWHSDFLQACKDDGKQALQIITSFGGDRLSAIRDGGGFFAKKGEEIIGAISYSPIGEKNNPNIIGLWVKNHNISIAGELIKCAVGALSYIGNKITVDIVFQDEHNAYTEENLGKTCYEKLDLFRHTII